jgi:hypothetical protein
MSRRDIKMFFVNKVTEPTVRGLCQNVVNDRTNDNVVNDKQKNDNVVDDRIT